MVLKVYAIEQSPLVAGLLDWEPVSVLFHGFLSYLITGKFVFYLTQFCIFTVLKSSRYVYE